LDDLLAFYVAWAILILLVCAWIFYDTSRNAREYAKMNADQRRMFWIVAASISVSMAVLWPVSLLVYVAAVVWDRSRRKL
jgi:uncharacterized membrane protein